MINRDLDPRKADIIEALVQGLGKEIEEVGDGWVSLERFIDMFLKIPTGELSNEIDLVQVMMGEFIVGVYNICGVVESMSPDKYFVPSSFFELVDDRFSDDNELKKKIVNHCLYAEASLRHLRLSTVFAFGKTLPLDLSIV